jgi:hypothetical protein
MLSYHERTVQWCETSCCLLASELHVIEVRNHPMCSVYWKVASRISLPINNGTRFLHIRASPTAYVNFVFS